MDRGNLYLAGMWLSLVIPVGAVAYLAFRGDESTKASYCAECAPIRFLLAKPKKTADEWAKLEELKKAYRKSAEGLAEYHRQSGDRFPLPMDLHPDCDCPCHLQIR